jgi:predicted dehydrogenase
LDTPLRIGLVGAGPWAQLFHAPMLAASPDVDLAGVWARRHDQAEMLAARHDTTAVAELDDLFDRCDAVAFAVPPDVQSDLAVKAARAGCHLLLDKPLGLDVAQAQAVADAARANGVVSQIILTNRYRPSVREFLADATGFAVHGARVAWVAGGAIPGAYFATPWRIEHGALLDLGPHVLDLLEAAVGPIIDIRSAGDPTHWTELTCIHEGGAVSQASLSITTPIDPGVSRFELYGPTGSMVLDTAQNAHDFRDAMAAIPAELAAAVASGEGHPLDANHGLHLQQLMATARGPAHRQLRSG